ncbi:MAG: hypothetical protein ACK55I_48620, partial [bacterium]
MEAEGGGLTPITIGAITALVEAEMAQNPVDGFWTRQPQTLLKGHQAVALAIAKEGFNPGLEGED